MLQPDRPLYSHTTDVRGSFNEYLRQACAPAPVLRPARGDDLTAWQARARRQLGARLCLAPRRTPLSLAEVARSPSVERAGVLVERLVYPTRPGLLAVAYLVRPASQGVRRPAVLCPPGHGDGTASLLAEGNATYKQYPVTLAQNGFVALVPEHIGFGERTLHPAHHAYHYHALNLLGESAMGWYVHDLQCALDILGELPEVSPERIGCYGLSLGGELALLLSAVDERVRVACISGFLTSYDATFLAEGHCGCGYVYGLRRDLEHADIAALICPRPLLVESGDNDPIFPVRAAIEAVDQLRAVYQAGGVGDRLSHRVFPGKHEVEQDSRALAWLHAWL